MASLFLSLLVSASLLDLSPQNDTRTPMNSSPEWNSGMVVLQTNDTITCKLRFNQMVPEGLLQVLDGENILTLSVKDVKSFLFFDAKRGRFRRFFTFFLPLNNSISREMFMEYVYGNDRVSILNHKTMGFAHAYMEFSPFKQATILNRQYLLDAETGKLLPMSKENALSLIADNPEVNTFIQKNGIRFRKVSDYIRIFEFNKSLEN
jgi:hypothetical protein